MREAIKCELNEFSKEEKATGKSEYDSCVAISKDKSFIWILVFLSVFGKI